MAHEALAKRYGRTMHAIHLLTTHGIVPLQSGQVPWLKPGSPEEEGYIAQRLTDYKDIIRTIFRTDTTSPSYPVKKHAFSVHSPHGNINVIPGVVSQVGLSTFPHNTTLFVYDRHGNVVSQYYMAGNPLIA